MILQRLKKWVPIFPTRVFSCFYVSSAAWQFCLLFVITTALHGSRYHVHSKQGKRRKCSCLVWSSLSVRKKLSRSIHNRPLTVCMTMPCNIQTGKGRKGKRERTTWDSWKKTEEREKENQRKLDCAWPGLSLRWESRVSKIMGSYKEEAWLEGRCRRAGVGQGV